MKTLSGTVEMSAQLYEATLRMRAAWDELEWIATHYDEATPEQRARLDRVIESIDAREDW